jgi:hypothetical protein
MGESEQWSSIVNIAEENRQNFCKALNRKTLFSVLHGTYTVALQELKALLKEISPASKSETSKCAASQEDDFKEVRRRKRHSTNEEIRLQRKQRVPPKSQPPRRLQPANSSPP